MEYLKPSATKLNSGELKNVVKAKANSSCGSIGCDGTWAGNEPDCADVYHNACLDEDNWNSGECEYGSWLDR